MNKMPISFLRHAVGLALIVWFPLLVWDTYYALYLYYAVCLVGIGFLFTGGWGRADKASKAFWIAALGVIVTTVLSLLVNDSPFSGWRNLESVHVKLLGVIPLAIALRELRLPHAYLWWGILLGASFAGFVALLEIRQHAGAGFWALLSSSYRVTGGEHSVIFGMLCSALAVLALSGGAYFFRLGALGTTAWAVGTLLAVGACLLTGTRIAWFALVAGGLVLAFLRMSKLGRGKSSAWNFVVVGSVLLSSLLLYQLPRVQDRLSEGYLDAKAYFSRAPGERVRGSLGARFEMWRASFQIFTEHPAFGVGLGPEGYEAAKHGLVSEKMFDPVIDEFGHSHNQYLYLLATRGIIGAAAFAFLFVCLFRLYWGALRVNREGVPIAISGLMITSAYLVFAISEVPLEHKRIMLLFVFSAGVLSGMASSRRGVEGSSPLNESHDSYQEPKL